MALAISAVVFTRESTISAALLNQTFDVKPAFLPLLICISQLSPLTSLDYICLFLPAISSSSYALLSLQTILHLFYEMVPYTSIKRSKLIYWTEIRLPMSVELITPTVGYSVAYPRFENISSLRAIIHLWQTDWVLLYLHMAIHPIQNPPGCYVWAT